MDYVFVDPEDEQELRDVLTEYNIRYDPPIFESDNGLTVSLFGDETNRLMRGLRQNGVDYDVQI